MRSAPLFRTAPLGPAQPAFLNSAVRLVAPDMQPGGLWHSGFMGGRGSPVTGPFSSWTVTGGTGPLQRGLGQQPLAQSGTLPRAAEVKRALDSHGFDCPPYAAGDRGGGAGLAAPPAPAAAECELIRR